MAEKRATLILELKDLASKGLGSVKNAFESLTSSVLGVSLTIGGMIAAGMQAIEAFSESEVASKRLTQALINQGITSEAVRDDLIAYANQLQKVSTFSDETLVHNQALLVSFGLTGDKLKTTLVAAMDLAIGRQIDLGTATMLLGKAYAGNTEALSRYGIKINESLPPSQRFKEVLSQINANFGGQAAAAADTYAGRVAILKNQFSDLMERIGGKLIPVAEAMIKIFSISIDVFGQVASKVMAVSNALQEVFLWAAKTGAAIGDSVFGRTREAMAEVEKLKDAAAGVRPPNATVSQEETDAHNARLLMLAKETEEVNRQYENFILTEDQKRDKEAQNLAARLASRGEFDKAADVLRKRDLDKEKDALEKRKVAFESTMNFISSLSTSKNKELAAIGKAAAIADATINTYRAANVALASAPPPFNFALAALVTAAGVANISKIMGTPLKTGGVVMPTSGGTLATIGEGGKAEAVIPLGDDRAKDQLRDTLGGGATEIHIHAGVVVADQFAIAEFARKIDEELFKLSRNKKSVAF